MEGYKLVITKNGKNGERKSAVVGYPLTQECLVAIEDDFKRYSQEQEVVELHLMRYDANGVHELRRYEKC